MIIFKNCSYLIQFSVPARRRILLLMPEQQSRYTI